MRYVVTGAHGMLGQDMVTRLANRNVLALSHAALDITELDAVMTVLHAGDVVINCAAYNAVDAAESDPEPAIRINSIGPAVLAEAVRQRAGTLVHVSTDYVFDGTERTPYAESHPRSPVSAYGRSKAEGEVNALRNHPDGTYVVRTAWLYGAFGTNFARAVLKRAQSGDELRVVDDQVGQPTWTADLAQQIQLLLDGDAPVGIYHGTNAGQSSWFDFARAVLDECGLDSTPIQRSSSAEFQRPAPRPNYSVLSHQRWIDAGIAPMREWRDALRSAVADGVFGDELD